MFRQSPIHARKVSDTLGTIHVIPSAAEGSSRRRSGSAAAGGLDSSTPLRFARNDLIYSALFVTLLFLFLLFPGQVNAKRKLPSVSTGKTTAGSVSGRVAAKVKFRADRRAVILNLANLSSAKSVGYELQYESNGLTQGAGGSVTFAGDSESREILFGSCSAGVCNYDKNIKNAKLTVTTTLKNGKKIVKPFRLKV